MANLVVTPSPKTLAFDLLSIIFEDGDRLERIDHYIHGQHDDPYMPKTADKEYRLLAKRAVSNWMPLLIGTPAQALYVDGFRPSRKLADQESERQTPEWEHWQNSLLDAKQIAVHRAALGYGHSFTLTEKRAKDQKIVTKGLSPLRTAALYEDAANDNDPYAALTILRFANGDTKGEARMWDATFEYSVSFGALNDDTSITTKKVGKHGLPECPVTRFCAAVDLEGRTVGVVEPLISLQNRINQTVFDLLVAQTYGSFKVRYATGMAPPMTIQWFDENGVPQASGPLDAENPPSGWTRKSVPVPMDHNARRFLFAEDEKAKFGSLDETPLEGFIQSIEMSVKHLSALAQVPPHHLLGQIANLSAEALQAAETSLSRKVEEFRKSFGESWERVFRLAGELAGDAGSADDMGGEVLWRDMEQKSLAQSADALGKMAEALDIPKRGLWSRVPNVTQNEIDYWEELRETEDYELQMAEALDRASRPGSPQDGESQTRGNLTEAV
jgi:hypothetical protein